MTERLLQFIWQQQYYNKMDLLTQHGELLIVMNPGTYNTNQGPDFLSARIRVNETVLAGNIELHLRAQDWNRHGHTGDEHYENIILHVVWEDDGFHLPAVSTLLLGPRVSKLLLGRYEEWMNNRSFVPCGERLSEMDALTLRSWVDRMSMERLSAKASNVRAVLEFCRNSWDECLWRVVAQNFGLPRNAELFGEVAASLPLILLLRHRHQPTVLEALLMGQAGLLSESPVDRYHAGLCREYQFFRTKYGLRKIHNRPEFLRMRPQGFPAIRLSQLAAMIHEQRLNFSLWKDENDPMQAVKIFDVHASGYWDDHSGPDRPAAFVKKRVGRQMAENFVINSMLPVFYCYGNLYGDEKMVSKAVEWSNTLTAERNNITRGWATSGYVCGSAWESQAMIHLKKQYCDEKRCLDCAIGKQLLKPVDTNGRMPGCR